MVEFVALALATWRLTSLLVWEDGPFEVFARLRHRLGVRYVEGSSQGYGTNWFAKGVVCPACASVWFGIAWAIAYLLYPPTWLVALPFALSAGAIIVERWNNG
ncbi:MAG: hypothetical protein AMJ93_14640 [Anaerolineae bacterium SM23_84]|nr:MAG: hypothetical protein AMJ93_14640 [Anaerolineae bacterium SM23_84]